MTKLQVLVELINNQCRNKPMPNAEAVFPYWLVARVGLEECDRWLMHVFGWGVRNAYNSHLRRAWQSPRATIARLYGDVPW